MSEQELARRAKRRLAIIQHAEEETGNVAMTCRYFGISRHAYYYWYRRYQELGWRGSRTDLPALSTAQERPTET